LGCIQDRRGGEKSKRGMTFERTAQRKRGGRHLKNGGLKGDEKQEEKGNYRKRDFSDELAVTEKTKQGKKGKRRRFDQGVNSTGARGGRGARGKYQKAS